MKILLADDDVTSRMILMSMLQKQGHEVIAAPDGAAAWEILNNPDPPKLIMLDWMMPGYTGIELCKMIRERFTKFPPYIIFVTSMESKEDIVEGLNAGANDYIVKPCNMNEVAARVAVGCRVIELQDALAKRVQELEDALAHIKRLQGILPICMYCHKIRTDRESWEQIEKYISEHSEAVFSHGICPDCFKKVMQSKEVQEFKNGTNTQSDV